jgi:hypothetical protein
MQVKMNYPLIMKGRGPKSPLPFIIRGIGHFLPDFFTRLGRPKLVKKALPPYNEGKGAKKPPSLHYKGVGLFHQVIFVAFFFVRRCPLTNIIEATKSL